MPHLQGLPTKSTMACKIFRELSYRMPIYNGNESVTIAFQRQHTLDCALPFRLRIDVKMIFSLHLILCGNMFTTNVNELVGGALGR